MSTPRRIHPLRDVALAFSLLTVLPVHVEWSAEERPDIAGWFPLVGVTLGLIAAGLLLAAETILGLTGADPAGGLASVAWVLSIVIVIAWALATRLLHWDGLADTADGIGGAHDHEARRAIMSDSTTGAFGATAIVFVAFAQIASLALITGAPAPSYALLVAVPVLGRLSATFACWLGKPAKPDGLGASVMGRPGIIGAAVTVAVLGACGAMLFATTGVTGLDWLFGGIVVAAAVPHLLARSVGGVTGDILGASVLLTETVVLFAATLVVIV